MAKMLGRTEGTARQRMRILGIVVPSEIIQKFKDDSRFKKGQTPPNKGKKMPPELYKKCAPTMFKKGQVSVNKKPVGSERIDKDGYYWVKTKNPRTWRMKHVLLWEKKRGKVPKGMIVIFKDKNRANIKISNLKIITRSQHMKRNSIHAYGPEIARIHQLRGALTRQINKLKRA